MNLERLIAVARGDAPADLVLANARIVNTFTAEIEAGQVAIAEGRIAGIGDYQDAARTIDLGGRYLAPGLIDGHTHVESTYLSVEEYARALVPRGVLFAACDPHEVANVAGLPGVRYLLRASRRVPMDVRFLASSCVPATGPALETAGARLTPADTARMLRWKGMIGLAEMMNFPGVIQGEATTLAKLRAARGRVRDGHAPGVTGKALNAYLAPLIGSEHEATSAAEGREKVRRGMRLMIRQGGYCEQNLPDLLPVVTDGNYHRCLLVVDDRSALDLLEDGDLDAVVRLAIDLGLDPLRALQMATIVPAEYLRLEGLGAIAPGYWANCFVFSDLRAPRAESVFYRGRLVAEGGQALFRRTPRPDPALLQTVRIRPFEVSDLRLPAPDRPTFPVIQIVPGQILTRRVDLAPTVRDGAIVSDPGRDQLKIVVVERHQASGRIGKGLASGFGLRRGALASSVGHDSHNILAVGVDDAAIVRAVRAIEERQGGLVVATADEILAALPLPVMGLLSTDPLEIVAEGLRQVNAAAASLGCVLPSPFATLSFLALPVIPELKLSDRGLIDATRVELLPA